MVVTQAVKSYMMLSDCGVFNIAVEKNLWKSKDRTELQFSKMFSSYYDIEHFYNFEEEYMLRHLQELKNRRNIEIIKADIALSTHKKLYLKLKFKRKLQKCLNN